MPRRWFLANVGLGAVALALLMGIGREATRSRPLPSALSTPALMPVSAGVEDPGPRDKAPAPPAGYEPVAARSLFSPTRSEISRAAENSSIARPRPILHGVVVLGAQSRAYLEDPTEKRVFGYAVGDAIASGRLERILDDRAVIRMSDGVLEVLLRDPAKPRPSTQPATRPPAAPRPGGRTSP